MEDNITGNNRRIICLVTNWYPTKENPYLGSFFKEQAFALYGYYDFIVLHYKERRSLLSSVLYGWKFINKEKNTKEYLLSVRLSVWYDVLNLVSNVLLAAKKGEKPIGVGKLVSSSLIRHRKRVIRKSLSDAKLEFDVLYCVDAQLEAGIVNIISEITDKPFVISEHSPVPPPGLLISDFNYFAIEKADLFLAISHDKVRQLMMQNIKLPQIDYIGNMVDDDKYLLSVDKHVTKTILMVGANSFYKNYALFVDIFENLVRITSVDFHVIVAGYAANKGYAKDVDAFEANLKNSSFSNKLELIPEVDHDKIQKIYNRADVFLMTSIQEGQPLAALEAACCGLPIFSTRCGGVEDYVDEKMGRIYELTDSHGMACGLRDFIEGDISFDSVYIRNKVIEKYGKKRFVQSFSGAFNMVIDRNIDKGICQKRHE